MDRSHTAPFVVSALVALVLTSPAAGQTWIDVGDQGLPSVAVQDLLVAPDDTLWAATARGLARMRTFETDEPDWSQATWTPLETTQGRSYRCLASSPDGSVWAGLDVDDGSPVLQRFEADGTPVPIDPFLAEATSAAARFERTVLSLAHDPTSGGLWIGTDGLLYHATPTELSWSVIPYALGGESEGVEGIAVDGSGRAWFVNNDGLWTFLPGTESGPRLVTQAGAGLVAVASTILNGTDLLVLGGRTNDEAWIYDIAQERATPLSRADPTASRPVNGVAVDPAGRVWTAGEQILRYEPFDAGEPASWTFDVMDPRGSPVGSDVADLVVRGRDDTVWVAGSAGVAVLTGRWEVSDLESVFECEDCPSIETIAFGPGDASVWFGSNQGLARFDGSEWTIVGSATESQQGRTNFDFDDEGRVWIAAAKGRSSYVEARDRVSLEPVSDVFTDSPSWAANDLVVDDDGILWLAAFDGLRTFDPPDTTTLRRFPSLYSLVESDALRGELDTEGPWVVLGIDDEVTRIDRRTAETITLSLVGDVGLGEDVEIEDVLVRDAYVYVSTVTHGLVRLPITFAAGSAVVLDPTTDPAVPIAPGRLSDDETTLWLVPDQDGLVRLDPQLVRARRFDLGRELPSLGTDAKDVRAVAVRSGRVWVSLATRAVATRRLGPPSIEVTRPEPVYADPLAPVELDVRRFDPDGIAEEVTVLWRVLGGPDEGVREGPVVFVPRALGLTDGNYDIEVWSRDADLNEQRTRDRFAFEMDLEPPVPVLLEPGSGTAVAGSADLVGTAVDPDRRFARYEIDARPAASDADAWQRIAVGVDEVRGDRLGRWDTLSFPDDRYRIRLAVIDTLEARGETFAEVVVDNEFPFAAETSPVRMDGDVGGDVYSPRADARLTVPPFAFEGVETIRVEADPINDAFVVIDDDFRLRKAARLRIRVFDAGRTVLFRRTDASSWQRIGGTPESIGGVDVVTATIDRGGTYALRADEAPVTSSVVLTGLDARPRHFRPRTGAFGDEVVVSFELGRAGAVRVVVYDRDGRPRRELADGRRFGPGRQTLTWDGRDQDGDSVEVGLYVIALETGGQTETIVVTVGYD